jgi:hypothetical protein
MFPILSGKKFCAIASEMKNWKMTSKKKQLFSNCVDMLNSEKQRLKIFPHTDNIKKGEEDIFIFITTHLCSNQT